MPENDPGKDPVEKALRLFVYGPVGFAAYLRDSGPTLFDVFASRGRREVEGAKRVVEERLGITKPEPPPSPSPSVQQRVADTLGRAASQAGSVVAAVAGPVVGAATGGVIPANGTASRGAGGAAASSAPSSPRPSGIPSVGNPSTAVAGAAEATTGEHGADLPIPGYDLLSASQVIERLEGLSRGALERIRVYELAHRARRTILASIDQLTS